MRRPLLITRPKALGLEFASFVEANLPGQFEPVFSPLLEIRPEPGSVDLEGAQALLFSSRMGVRSFASRSSDRSLPALCVGPGTALEATNAGFAAISADGDVSALAALAVQSYLPEFGHMLYFRGSESVGDIVGSLGAEGIPAEERILYDQVPLPLSIEARNKVDGNNAIAAVFSPRSAALLAEELSRLDTRAMQFVAISANAAAPLSGLDVARTCIASVPNSKAVLEMLKVI